MSPRWSLPWGFRHPTSSGKYRVVSPFRMQGWLRTSPRLSSVPHTKLIMSKTSLTTAAPSELLLPTSSSSLGLLHSPRPQGPEISVSRAQKPPSPLDSSVGASSFLPLLPSPSAMVPPDAAPLPRAPPPAAKPPLLRKPRVLPCPRAAPLLSRGLGTKLGLPM